MTLLLALLTIAAWGCWLWPAQAAGARPRPVVVAYVTLANLLLSAGFRFLTPTGASTELDGVAWATIFGGGVLWTISGVCAFAATHRLGIARAMGLWSPLNILVSIGWGALLFGEFRGWSAAELGLAALAIILLLAGLLAIIGSSETGAVAIERGRSGLLFALATGILWGSYFVPIRLLEIPAAAAVWPMSVGMVVAAVLNVVVLRIPLLVQPTGDAVRLLASGALWGAGNLGSLALMERIGAGRGFALAQLCLVVNAALGIYLLRQPAPGTRAARRALAGCSLATAGGVLLGLAR